MRKQSLGRTLCELTLALWLIPWPAAVTANAQPPASIAGATFLGAVMDGAPPFADSGYFLFVPATSGNTFQIIKISDGFGSTGTYTYSASGPAGSFQLNDNSVGAITGEFDYDDNVSGSYSINNTSTGFQDGSFLMFPAWAPASLAGQTLSCSIDDGNTPFASAGSFTLKIAPSGTSYTIIGDGAEVSTSWGGCTYSTFTKSAGQAQVSDSIAGSFTAYFAFTDGSSGSFAITQPSTGGFQVGEFTVLDTIAPTVSITSPTNGMSVTSSNFTITGTAHDNVGVSDLFYSLNGADWTEASSTNDNWSPWYADEVLVPGTNVVQAYSVDNSGNNSATKTVTFFYALKTPLSLTFYGSGTGTTSITNGAGLDVARTYALTATAAPGCVFTGWTGNTNLTNATFHFVMQPGLAFTADFEDVQKPTLAITTPTNGMTVTTPNFTIKGTAHDNVGVRAVTCLLNGNPQTVNTSNFWTNWNAAVTLTPGTNLVTAFSSDPTGNNSSNHNVSLFYLLKTPLSVAVSGGKGTASLANGTLLPIGRMQAITATAAPGYKFTGWSGTTNATNATLHFMMESNFALIANFQDATPPTVSITSPTNGLVVTNFSVNVTGKAADNVAVTNVYFSTNHGVVWTSANTANNWTNWTAIAPLALGSNVIQAYSEDSSGSNSTVKSVTVIRQPVRTTFPVGSYAISNPQAQIAFDGTNYLAVFQTQSLGVSATVAQFISQSGTLLDSGLQHIVPIDESDPPAVAFDGANYLVASATSGQASNRVEGAFLSPDGTGGAAEQLTQSLTVDSFNTLIYGGGVYFLEWADSINSSSNGGHDCIYGAMVNPDGSIAVSDFEIAATGMQAEGGQGYAAFDGTNFLATWGSASGGASVSGRIISPSGVMTDPFTIYTNHTVAAGTTITAAVFDGTKYLVLFNAGLGSGASTNWHIGGRFVTTAGQVLTNQITITSDAGPQIVPCATFDGEHYLVTWNQGFNPFAAVGTTAGNIKARFFDFNGHPIAPEFTLLSPSSGQTALWATPFFDGSQFFCVVGSGHETSAAPNLKFSNGVLTGAFISQ